MVTMENSEETLQILERFTRLKQKEIPKELEDYLQYVAKTGDTIFRWSSVKYLFREKLLNVIKHFNEDSQRLEEIPNYPNVDPFNYETMKSSLLERLDQFNASPFTVQRLCELLINPRKQYSRIDKYMRALEKNILVVSTVDPGRKRTDSENGDSLDSVGNGDLSLEVNIDIEMENENIFTSVDERNGNNEESTPITQKTASPRADDTSVQPKAKKAKLDFEDTELREEADPDADEVAKTKPEKRNEEDDADRLGDADSTVKSQKLDKIEIVVAAASAAVAEIGGPDEEDGEPKAKKAFNGDKDHKEAPESTNDRPATAQAATEDSSPDAPTILGENENARSPADEVDKATVEHQPKLELKTDENEKTDKKIADTPVDKKPEEDEVVPAADKADSETASESSKLETSNKMEDHKEAETTKEQAAVESEASTAAASEKMDKDVLNEGVKAPVDSEAKTDKELEANPKEVVIEGSSNTTDKTEQDAEPEATASAATSTDIAAEEPTKDKEEESLDKTATAEVASEKSTDDSPAADVPAIETTADAVVASVASDSVTAAAETDAVPVPIETDEIVTTPQSPIATEATVTSAADAVAAAFAVAAPPALALNDQPMEDAPADEDADTLPSAAAVEEVIMAESTAVSGATEMATDESAAMEVDDTSQEVMDQ